MVKNCPYCGEEQSALKNHVRLASGDGHGPSGQYPDDFTDDGPDQDGPDPGGGREAVALDDHGATTEPVDGGGGAVTVEAVEDAEPEEVPKYDADVDDDAESIVAMPESELNEMLRATGNAVTGGGEPEESTEVDGEDLSVDSPSLDADEVAAKADENGWGLETIVVLAVITVLAGAVSGALRDAAETATQKRQQWSESDAGVEVL
jgi:hypothetical protein